MRLRDTEEYQNLEKAIAALQAKQLELNIEKGIWPEGYMQDCYMSEWGVVTYWSNLDEESSGIAGQYVTFESEAVPHRSKGLFAEAISLIEEEQAQCTCGGEEG